MGLDYAIEELYATGWSPLDSRQCDHHASGRLYPLPGRVSEEFAAAGFDLTIKHVQLFDCYRAEWSDRATGASGAVVGHAEDEAAVFALSQLRRHLSSAAVGSA